MVYPRVGGGNRYSPPPPSPIWGLSPRGRGKLALRLADGADSRSIPAWAGETITRKIHDLTERVYPRVGGGNPSSSIRTETPHGLSPRGRGKPAVHHRRVPSLRSIPAWAGETAHRIACRTQSPVYPRVGGGNSPSRALGTTCCGLSPRGRGKPLQVHSFLS